ncbi:MAG: MFS transporter [Acetobacteraceae bacterium]
MKFARPYHGWLVVGVCFIAALFTWGFGVFGASVYLSQITRVHGWSVSLVSMAVTLFYLTNAASLTLVGAAIDRHGSRPVILFGGCALSLAVIGIGQATAPWHLFAAFVVMGLGYATLSLTGLSATIAPWFERHQGRSVAIALMGASFGAMVVVPLLVMAITRFGFSTALMGGGVVVAAVLLPLAWVVLRHRGPRDLGLAPDGEPIRAEATTRAAAVPAWTRGGAIRTPALWTIAIGFALGLIVQVGFLTHHLKLAEPILGTVGAGWLVSATGLAGLLGRTVLATIADRVNVRLWSCGIFALQTLALGLMSVWLTPAVLIATSLVYGFCLGQITTLSPIVVRREFGAASYGAIYSVAATVIQLSSAFGPTMYGVLRDLCGGYAPVLAIAAGFEAAAMAIVLSGHFTRREPR